MVTPADIKALPSGEFTHLSDEIIQATINRSKLQLHEPTWGELYDLGLLYLTAHDLVNLIEGGRGVSGPVTHHKAGPFSKGYSTIAMDGGSYATTSYGQKYIQLRRQLGIMGFVP